MQPAPSSWWQRWKRRTPGGASAAPAAAGAAPAAARPSFGPYQALGVLGQGATGPVYLAQAGERQAAIKLLVTDPALPAAEQADQRQRFLLQAEVLRGLAHEDIVTVLDAGEREGQPWIALELAPGTDLSRYTRAQRLLPEPLVLRIGARIARALAHAHERGIVHRDLKPANVRLDVASGRLKLVDFGVARLQDQAVTRTGVTLGTPAYMAPEQLLGEPADARTDTYALGVMLYELLTGRLPFPATTLGELLRAVAGGEPAPLRHWRPELPAGLEALLQQILQRAPGLRPQSLPALAAELERWADALPQPPPP
ncbi:serine/threonine-protein kinase [Aquabacterium sp.]|uniref:serine/threonine-protein kinase n=1 Tax=Aquabacterium sp. TaxID=1872578 RepID=UPI0037841F6E